jgi:hypothetical protein
MSGGKPYIHESAQLSNPAVIVDQSEGPLSVDGQVKPTLDSDFFHFG